MLTTHEIQLPDALKIARTIASEVANQAGATWLRAHPKPGCNTGFVLELELANYNFRINLSSFDLKNPDHSANLILKQVKARQYLPTTLA